MSTATPTEAARAASTLAQAPANAVTSQDGTRIAVTRAGEGPPLILVDPALCQRTFGPMPKLVPLLTDRFTVYTYDRRGRGASADTAPYSVEREVEDLEAVIAHAGGSVFVYGISSGGALALEAAKRLTTIEKLAIYEVPFIVDAGHTPMTDELREQFDASVASGRRGDAVKLFMRFVGTPRAFIAMMRLTPMWSKLAAVAHTLPYDIAILANHQQGEALTGEEWPDATPPTLVLVGGKSPAWLRNGGAALADVLPDARLQTLDGQTHMVKPRVLAPALRAFFSD